MKLIINYDFFDRIKDVNERLGPLKIIRNNKSYLMIHFPICMTIDLISNSFPLALAKYVFELAFGLGICLFIDSDYGKIADPYKMYSQRVLSNDLEPKLKQLYIDTDINLLLESQLYKTNYKIEFNKNKLPFIFQTKYLLIKTYTAVGEVKNTSIKQEHMIGAREYVLSIGSHNKKRKQVYAIE